MRKGLKIHVSPVQSRPCPLPTSPLHNAENQASKPDSSARPSGGRNSPTSPHTLLTTEQNHCAPHSAQAATIGDVLREAEKQARKVQEYRAVPGQGFIYFLVNGEEVVYIGQTIRLAVRIAEHECCSEKRGQFDRVFYFSLAKSQLLTTEQAFIQQFKPRLNGGFKPMLPHVEWRPADPPHGAKLTSAQVEECRRAPRNMPGGVCVMLAKKFGVSRYLVAAIRAGQQRKSVLAPAAQIGGGT